MMQRDLLEDVLSGATEGDVVVRNGATNGGWHVYSSSRGGSWVADMLRASEGEEQTARALHLRTANREGHPGQFATWHRSYFLTHFVRPVVHCSFRIDRHDEGDGRVGFKLAYLHQDNLTSYYVMLHCDGRAQVYREARDSDEVDSAGTSLAKGSWDHKPGVRRHLTVLQDDKGVITVVVDGRVILRAEDPAPWHSGQVGLRLDGLDARIFSLAVRAADSWEPPVLHPDVADWAEDDWLEAIERGIVNGMDSDHPSNPVAHVPKQEVVSMLLRGD